MKFRADDVMARTLLLILCLTVLVAQANSKPDYSDESKRDASGVSATQIESSLISARFKMTAQRAHQLISEQQADLLGDGSQLVSLYYFGQNNATSVVGLERVGDDYLPIRWLLVFKGQDLLGWYYPVGEFPSRFKSGHLSFPRGASEEDIFLFPYPPSLMLVEGIEIPFISHQVPPQ